MKNLLLGCILSCSVASAAPVAYAGPASHAEGPSKKVAFYFSRTSTFAQLVAIKQEVAKDGILLEYDRLEFDKNGYLAKIAFHVDCEGYTWGSATDDDLPSDFSFGFFRDFTPGAKEQFRIGNLK